MPQLALLDTAVVLKPVRRVEFVVAEKLPHGTVDLVGAGLDCCVQHGARGTSKLRAEVRRLDLELRESINGRQDDKVCAVQEVSGVGVVVDAVQQIIVLRGLQPIGCKRARTRVATRVCLGSIHTSANLSEKRKVAAV